MKECYNCGFNDEDYGCTCPHSDRWYACPIENKKPENIQTLKEYAEWLPQYESKWVTESDVLGIPPKNANQYDYYKPDPDKQDNQTKKRWLTADGKEPKEHKYLSTGNKKVVIMKPKGFNDNWII